MGEFREEQELELEALESIFLDDYQKICDDPISFSIQMKPFNGADTEDPLLNTFLPLKFTFTPKYPEESPLIETAESTETDADVISNFDNELVIEMIELMKAEVDANIGLPMVFSLVESGIDFLVAKKDRLKKSLEQKALENQNDGSMYSQMMLKQKQKELGEKHKQEQEEKENGGPKGTGLQKKTFATHTEVTKETFLAWREKYYAEIKASKNEKEEKNEGMTGKEFFLSQKDDQVKDVEIGEEALQNIDFEKLDLGEPSDNELDGVNEELFLEEDEDLDDLDDLTDSE